MIRSFFFAAFICYYNENVPELHGVIKVTFLSGCASEIGDSEFESLLTINFTDDASVFANNDSVLFNQNSIPAIFEYPDAVPEIETTIENPEVASKQHLLGNSKLRVVLLSIIIQFISILSSTSFSDYLFLPLFILESTEFFLTQPATTNSMLITLLGLSGIKPTNATRLIRIGQGVQKCFEDGCLYLFIYVLLNILIKLSI